MVISEGGTTAQSNEPPSSEVLLPEEKSGKRWKTIKQKIQALVLGLSLLTTVPLPAHANTSLVDHSDSASAYSLKSEINLDILKSLLLEQEFDEIPDEEPLTLEEVKYILEQIRLPFRGKSLIPLGPQTFSHSGEECIVPKPINHAPEFRTDEAIDFELLYGAEVLAVADGTVVFSQMDDVTDGRSSEHTMIILFIAYKPDGKPVLLLARYGHLQIDSMLPVGTTVKKGQPIAKVDYMAKDYGNPKAHPHLHFQIERALFKDLMSSLLSATQFPATLWPLDTEEVPLRYHPDLVWSGPNDPERTCNVGEWYDGLGHGTSLSSQVRSLLTGKRQQQPFSEYMRVWDNNRHGINNNQPRNVASATLPAPQRPHRVQAR